MEIFTQSEETQLCKGHQSDPQRSDRTAIQRSGWQDLVKHCATSSTQDSIPVALMNGHRLGVKITNQEIAPRVQSPSFPKITQDVPNTHVQQTMNTSGTTREEEVQSEDTQSEEDDGGHQLDLVYDAVKKGQSLHELERDGWYAHEIHKMKKFVKSPEKSLSLALGSGI